MAVSYTQFSSVSAKLQFPTMMSLKLNSPAANGFQILRPLTKSNMCILSIRSYGTRPIARPRIACNMNIAAGQSDEPHKFNLENIIDRARKLWDSTPTPVKSFPWNRALDNFVQLILDIVLIVTKYLYVPVLVVTSISELSYCAHERKLYITLFPFLVGVAIAGILKSAALESSPSLKNAEVPWHLIAIGFFFTLLKLPGPYYPYWGRIFIPHFANGALFRTLWFAFLWYRRPRKSLEKTLPDSVVIDPEQKEL
ncbi:uncharacterized protein LOC107766206 [Nicotiana tabacum]|uniref:Uncharacterized protein LOC107766206 n=1 Tax=Nicotiana tabacum TaxID=4097 RepID=A0A1S3XKK0_TOBAC|nr:uncharacterized protein LOC104115973 [Nicotiana tomentosiformis]XP_016440443.1 PREDICTED: uncharacterized protein LOC107766206 [Nicotiana tabacum]